MISKPNISSYSPQDVENILEQCIQLVTSNIACYSRDAVSDFTRKHKLPPEILIRFIMQMQAKGTKSELCDFFHDHSDMPSDSAFCQQRGKISPAAFQRIMYLFNHSFRNYLKLKGYHIMACDGSDVNIPFDSNDKETFCQHGSNKPYSQFHVNALYDCLNDMYWDAVIDCASKTRECDALKEMILKHNYPEQSIIVADRGYEKYDLIACCIENGQKFIFRIKKVLTRKQTNK